MKHLLPYLFILSFFQINAQESDNRWYASAAFGHHSLSLLSPQFSTVHPGLKLGLSYQWNRSNKHQFIQTMNASYFSHKHFQKATQIYSEIAYRLVLNNKLSITPLSIGGGYVLSISDLDSFVWNEDTESYVSANKTNHNWLISLGPSISYSIGGLLNRPVNLFLDYRIQVQGVVIQETVPIVAYAPLHVGFSIPVHKKQQDEK